MSDSEEKSGDSLRVVELFAAIRNKDEQALAVVLEHSTIKTVLMFQTKYGISPLACCIRTGDVSHLGLVRCLLRSGLCDSEVVDGIGETVLANLAHAPNYNLNFLQHLIEIVIEGVDDTTACYMMLKHNSLELFKVFLAVKQYDEGRLFGILASALTKLNVKQFRLPTNLKMFVLWKLGDYGYKHLSGDWMGSRQTSSDAWKAHVDVISACWNHIAEKYDTGTYENIDGQLLYRLHVIHNHLYFLQHIQFLEYLPLREAIFCLAIFINTFKPQPSLSFEVYHLTVHKCLVVDFVRMISFQLVRVKRCLESAEQELMSLMADAESFIAPMKIDLIEELAKRVELSVVGNQQYSSQNRLNSNKDEVIRILMQKVKKADRKCGEVKMGELKAIREKQHDYLIKELKSRLKHVVHPQNIADRIIAQTKRTPSADHSVIAADIVAGALFNLEHLMRGKDRRTRRRLIKCYSQMKQLYSLNKIITTFGHVAAVSPTNVEVFRDCLKRAVTVLGETMKSTKSTPNMPNDRLQDALEQMLTSHFSEINILHRNNYAREFSLARLVINGELERRVYSVIPKHTACISMVINLLFVILLADIRRSFYGLLVRCSTMQQLRALLIMAGEKDTVLQMQQNALQAVHLYFTNIRTLFVELREGQVAQTVQFTDVEKQFIVQCSIVEELEAMLAVEAEFNFESLRKTCFSCNCISTIRRMLHWKINSYHPNRLLETICTKWDPNLENLSYIELLDHRITWINPTTVTNNLLMLLKVYSSADETHQLYRTRELIETMEVVVAEEDAILELNRMLRPYYENIFFLDNKWKALEAFCRRRQLPWNTSLVRKLRRTDQAHLQALFDERRAKLRSILEQNDIRMVNALDVAVIILDKDIRASLEHLQLELCEMLIAVGYFGDSFHYVKQRIPMLQGKNYRNLLAHDSLSYNLLTDSGDEKLIVNVFIFTNTEVRLFDKKCNGPADLHFPSLEDTERWVEEQQKLLAAIRMNDLRKVYETMRSGGEIKSLFCSSRNIDHYPAANLPIECHLQGICNPDPSIIALLGLYIPNLPHLYQDSKFLFECAIVRRDFDAAIKFTNESGLFCEEFYSWPNFTSHTLFELIVSKMTPERVVEHFLDYGNESGVEEMVDHRNDHIITGSDPGIVCKAILRGLRSTVELFVRKAHRLHPKSLELAIVMHWNDVLSKIAEKTDIDDSVYVTLLRTSIKANNDTALKHVINNHQLTSDALRQCYLTAASFGRCAVLKYLLKHFPPMDRSVLSAAIHSATLYNHWQCVRLLLDADAAVDVLMPDYQGAESNVLLLLIMFEQSRLIRRIKSVNCSIYGTVTDHPFAVALRYDTASSTVLRALSALGFGWLDSSATLHEAILQGYDQPAWNIMWREIDDQLAPRSTPASDHCTLHTNVLQRWRLIAFVEECKMDRTALGCAAQLNDSRILCTLLDRLRSMRRYDDIGVLDDIAFLVGSSIVRHYKADKSVNGNVTSYCEDMISRIHTWHATTNDVHWKEHMIDAGDISIKFAIPAYLQISDNAAYFRITDSSSLTGSLQDLHKISNSLFTTHAMVYATFRKDDRTVYFLRIDNVCCAYDIYAPDRRIDLSNILNARAGGGETVLMTAIKHERQLEMVQMLVEEGANPLLADSHGSTPIGLAADYPSPELTLYLLDECLQRDLRNDEGVDVLTVSDGTGGYKLIHKATVNGHEEILARLFQLQVDATTQNIYGYTPAHIAAKIPLTNAISMMKQLLDYDRTPVDMLDITGATLLRLAGQVGSIEMLDLLMEYNPDLTLQPNRAALYQAIELQHVQWAKRFLEHAVDRGIPKVTSMEDNGDDAVILSMKCADLELSRALLEYELGHPLEEINVCDLPRIEAVLKASTSKIPQVPVEHLLKLKGLNESDNFLTFLQKLIQEPNP
ncbi:uncharacterized protein LOC128715392 [Anopheles marshallii]|uniref:uncharacterized protein LOC128715392 n=1 Tax=Anopheles marshallii TaxID=1521116 RepID=UPI00237C1C79|nr:uncharacterized protein LOC128715392 [Anopheles marshallii]